MTLKTSSFKINRTILKKTFFRFWPIWALYLIILIFIMPVNLFNNLIHGPVDSANAAIPGYLESQKLIDLLQVLDLNGVPVLIAVFAIIAAVSVFSYLYMAKSSNMLHAFPVTRKELYATNYLAGFLMLLLPAVVVFLLSLVVCLVMQVPGIAYLCMWLVAHVGMSFFFFSLAVFCCMLTGHFFGGFGFYVLFNVFYCVIAALFRSLAEQICYGLRLDGGIADVPGSFLSPAIYLSNAGRFDFSYKMSGLVVENVTVHGGAGVALYCIPAIILVLLGVFLYHRRHLECAAEMTAHAFVKPMLRWMVTIVGAAGLSMWFAIVLFDGSDLFLVALLAMMVVSSWCIFFVLEMAIQKRFKIFKKRRFLEWGICAILLLLSVGALETDVIGVEKRVPVASEVQGVIVYAEHDMLVTDPEDIAVILAAHQELIDHKAEYEAFVEDEALDRDENPSAFVRLEYVMKDGNGFKRGYTLPIGADYLYDKTRATGMIRALQEETNSHVESWLIQNHEDLEMLDGIVYKYTMYSASEVVLNKEQLEALYPAMLQDVKENNTRRLLGSETDATFENYDCHIEFTAMTEELPLTVHDQISALRAMVKDTSNKTGGTLEEPKEIATYYATSSYYDETATGKYIVNGYFDVYSTCEHTIKALLDLGIITSVDEINNNDQYKEDEVVYEVIYE